MPMQRSLLILAAMVLLIVGLVLPAIQQPSNCGGNSAALSACKQYAVILQMWADDHKGEHFWYESADAPTKRQLSDLDSAGWIGSARFLAKIDNVGLDRAAGRQIIIVCDRPYDNVPRHMFWKAPLTHAVGYSTGESGLISLDEFRQLDLTGFVDVQSLAGQ